MNMAAAQRSRKQWQDRVNRPQMNRLLRFDYFFSKKSMRAGFTSLNFDPPSNKGGLR